MERRDLTCMLCVMNDGRSSHCSGEALRNQNHCVLPLPLMGHGVDLDVEGRDGHCASLFTAGLA